MNQPHLSTQGGAHRCGSGHRSAPDDALDELVRQVAAADPLLVELAGVAGREQQTLLREEARETVLAEVSTAVTVPAVTRVAAPWRHRHASGFAIQAVQDAALAVLAQNLTDRWRAELNGTWAEALRVRDQLRAFGPQAETVAMRLIPHWSAPVAELAGTAAAIGQSPDSRAALSRRAT